MSKLVLHMTDTLEFGIASVEELPRIVQIKFAMFLESSHADLLASDAADTVLADYRHASLRARGSPVLCGSRR